MRRSSHDVAVQAIIFGALGFRASLEVTEHPRCATLCLQLLPWLEDLNVGRQVEVFHREILETPHGKLAREYWTEAFWRGEEAAFLGWAVQLFDRPHPTDFVDPGVLLQNLKILLSDASDLLSNARLRSEEQIDDYCAFCTKVRHQFELTSAAVHLQPVLQRIHKIRLDELGLSEAIARRNEIAIEAAQLASAAPSVTGLYFVRTLAGEWLLGKEL